MGILSVLGRGIKAAGREAPLASYLLGSGAIGAAASAPIGASMDPQDPARGALAAAIPGAAMGPVTAPAFFGGAATGVLPLAGAAGVAHMLHSGNAAEEARNRAVAKRLIDMQKQGASVQDMQSVLAQAGVRQSQVQNVVELANRMMRGEE